MFEAYIQNLQATLLYIFETDEGKYLDALPIPVPLAVTDTSLVPLAKHGFTKLPVPIQNILLAVVEYETLKARSSETAISNSLLKTLVDVDGLLRILSFSTEKLRSMRDDLLTHSRDLWSLELMSLGGPFEGDKPYEAFKDAYKRCLDRERLELVEDKVIDIKDTPDVSVLDARISLSKAYRKKAEQLFRNELEPVVFPSIPEKEESTVVMIARAPKEISEGIKAEKERFEVLRKKAMQLWSPYRASIQQMLSLEMSQTETLLRETIAKFVAHPIDVSTIPNKDLESEYKFAMQAFPCDASMVKLCMTVCLDGAKLRHTRKLMDLKSEYTTQFQVRLKQFQGHVHAYKDATAVPLL